MAARSISVNELLCYFSNKYGKFDNKKLSNIISDFYLPSVISEAKDLLVRDVEALNLVGKWPRPTRRRDSDLSARALKDIQDITAIWSHIDSLGLFRSLPIYVVANVDAVPTARFEDGDVRAIFSKLDKIEEATRDVKKSVNDFRASNANFCKSLDPVPVASFNYKPGLLRPHDPQRNLSVSADPSSNQEQSCTQMTVMTRPVACGGARPPLRFASPSCFFVSAGFRPRLAPPPPIDRAGPCCKIVTLRGW